jgi:SDR family mycofactocin-dependent oxidoreductase
MSDHSGKIALISGGARGQGRAIAARLSEKGADVAFFDVCDRPATSQYRGATPEDLHETQRIVEANGRRCIAEVIDVRDAARVAQFTDRVADELGRIDIVCANAGLVTWVPFLEITSEQWDEVISINLTGVFNTLQPALRHMVAQRSGVAVLTSSVNGLEPGDSIAHYTASKHGVVGLTKNLALEFGPHNIRVNAILPSAVNTVMGNNPTNLKWIFGTDDATEDDYLRATRQWHILRDQPALGVDVVAKTVDWLVGDDASAITGSLIPIDAGHLVLPGFNHNPIVDED